MNKTKKEIVIPDLMFNSDYFECPKCGWRYPGPLLVKGDIAHYTKCENCGHSYLIRVK